MTTQKLGTDPATIEVIRHALTAAAGEMMINVKRAAYSPSIHQIQDVCVGLVDADGSIVACAPGLPMFLADMGEVVRDGLEISRPGGIPARRCVHQQRSLHDRHPPQQRRHVLPYLFRP